MFVPLLLFGCTLPAIAALVYLQPPRRSPEDHRPCCIDVVGLHILVVIILHRTLRLYKDLQLLDHPDIDPLDSKKYGLNTKHVTKYSRNIAKTTSGIRQDHFVGWKALNILSRRTVTLSLIAKKIHNELLMIDLNGNRRPYYSQLALMVTVRKKYFQQGSKVYKQIIDEIKKIIKEKITETRAAAVKRRSEETFYNHVGIIQQLAENPDNYEMLPDGREVFICPQRFEAQYSYLYMLRNGDENDWRLLLLLEQGLDMDGYKEAQEQRSQAESDEFAETVRQRKNEPGVNEETESGEDVNEDNFDDVLFG